MLSAETLHLATCTGNLESAPAGGREGAHLPLHLQEREAGWDGHSVSKESMTPWLLQGQAQAYQGGCVSGEGLVDKRCNVCEG